MSALALSIRGQPLLRHALISCNISVTSLAKDLAMTPYRRSATSLGPFSASNQMTSPGTLAIEWMRPS